MSTQPMKATCRHSPRRRHMILILPMMAIFGTNSVILFWKAYARLYESHIASGTTVGDITPGTPELVTSRMNKRHESINIKKKIKQI